MAHHLLPHLWARVLVVLAALLLGAGGAVAETSQVVVHLSLNITERIDTLVQMGEFVDQNLNGLSTREEFGFDHAVGSQGIHDQLDVVTEELLLGLDVFDQGEVGRLESFENSRQTFEVLGQLLILFSRSVVPLYIPIVDLPG